MVNKPVTLFVGATALSVIFRMHQDGIMAGFLSVTIALLTLRGVAGVDGRLHSGNAWIMLGVLGVYLGTVLMLPRCYFDRTGTRFCRETQPGKEGPRWLDVLLGIFVMLCIVVMIEFNQTSNQPLTLTPGWVAVVLAVGVSLCMGWVLYGMNSVPITSKEERDVQLNGSIVDTSNQAVRILPGYKSSSHSSSTGYLARLK